MNTPMSKEESYADRRQLFKNIWETANNSDDKDGNVIYKPRVIKTLRLDEVNRCVAGKKKKQRIKKLRIVCNKLLNFCDRQDADDIFYEQMAKGRAHKEPKKLKNRNKIRKATKAKILYTPTLNVDTIDIFANPEDEKYQNNKTSPIKLTRATSICKTSLLKNKSLKPSSKNISENLRNKVKRNGAFPGTKILIRATNAYSNKQLFPLTKITIQ